MQTSKEYTLSDISVGLKVTVNSAFGCGPIVSGVISSLEKDIKLGHDGFCYTRTNGKHYWAYMNQLVSIEPIQVLS